MVAFAKRQRFVVHVELRQFLRQQTVTMRLKVYAAMLDVFMNVVTPVTCVAGILMKLMLR